MTRVLMKVTWEKCQGNWPTKFVTISLGRVPSYLRKCRNVKLVQWDLLDEPGPEEFPKLLAAMKALGSWAWG